MELRSQSNINVRANCSTASRTGFTVFEVVLSVALLAALAALVLPPLVRSLQQYEASGAATEVAALYTEARLRALSRGWDGEVGAVGDGHQIQLWAQGEMWREYLLPAQVSFVADSIFTRLSAEGSIGGDRVVELLHPLGAAQVAIQEGGVLVQ